MRTALYTLLFVAVGVPSIVLALDYAFYSAARISIRALFPRFGLFNIAPSRALWEPADYAAFAFAIALGALTIRRLAITFRTGKFTPDQFRGAAYVTAWVAFGCVLFAAVVYGLTRSLVLTSLAFTPASLVLWLAFVITEVTSVTRKVAPAHPNSTVEPDARKDSARGSL